VSDDVVIDGGRRRLAPVVTGVVAVVLLVLVVVMVRAGGDEGSSASTNLLDRPAPAVTGEYADGRVFELSRRKGSWVVLNFFTSTCIPCQREHPELIAFVDQQRSLGTSGAEFYTIVQHDEPAAVDAFFAANGGAWPIVYDTGFQFQNSFGVAQVPETWIIDPNGVVRGRIIAEVTSEFLSTTIQRLREGA
jgi:cytochrome c biogenesis protein CcmG, thiol:disulfide interchange protein DsbE